MNFGNGDPSSSNTFYQPTDDDEGCENTPLRAFVGFTCLPTPHKSQRTDSIFKSLFINDLVLTLEERGAMYVVKGDYESLRSEIRDEVRMILKGIGGMNVWRRVVGKLMLLLFGIISLNAKVS